MTINEEIQEWINLIRQEVDTLKIILSDEQDGIQTGQLIVEDSVEIKGDETEIDLYVEGVTQIDDSISTDEISSVLIDAFSQQLKNDQSFRSQVKGDKGGRGDKGERGDRGDKGERGDRGDKGERGDRGDIGEFGRNDRRHRPDRFPRVDDFDRLF